MVGLPHSSGPLGVIRPSEIRPGWLALYAATFGLQLLCAFVRGVICSALLWLVFHFLGIPLSLSGKLGMALAYGPLALSLATLLMPLGGWFWQQQAGGRTPSARERELFEDAFVTLQASRENLRPPRRWFVLDHAEPNGAVYADTLMLSRGMLESRWLTAVLAHELGHLHSSDGRLAAALHRLTLPPRRPLARPEGSLLIWGLIRAAQFVATGEMALWLTRVPWGIYWRGREYHADQYAAALGQGEALAAFLDIHALPHDVPVPYIWLTEHSHPPSEHRIDRLYHQQPDTSAEPEEHPIQTD